MEVKKGAQKSMQSSAQLSAGQGRAGQGRGLERTGDMEKRRRPGFGEPAATEPASLLPT